MGTAEKDQENGQQNPDLKKVNFFKRNYYFLQDTRERSWHVSKVWFLNMGGGHEMVR